MLKVINIYDRLISVLRAAYLLNTAVKYKRTKERMIIAKYNITNHLLYGVIVV